MGKLAKDLWKYRELLLILVARNIKIRYKRSALGFFWTLLNPVLLIIIYAVFLKILRFYRSGDPLFLPTLVSGIIAWQYLAMCLGDSLHAVVGNANLVTKTSFPRIILPLSTICANLVNFLLSLVILAIYLLIVGIRASHLWALPIVILTHFALCLGLGLILSALNVFFRDTEHLLSVVLVAWFFLTPIIYPFSQIPLRFQRPAFLNPMTGIVTAYRSIFLSTDLMAPRLAGMSMAIAWLVCLLGLFFFQMCQKRFADEL
ncbi:MAG: ABC transporter permease [Kiritimatiellae bacterium]|nr:ABC transporter permease [Kiritimatiellia bacterium]